jgi:hypothetical protein
MIDSNRHQNKLEKLNLYEYMQIHFIVQYVLHVLAPPGPSSKHRHFLFMRVSDNVLPKKSKHVARCEQQTYCLKIYL